MGSGTHVTVTALIRSAGRREVDRRPCGERRAIGGQPAASLRQGERGAAAAAAAPGEDGGGRLRAGLCAGQQGGGRRFRGEGPSRPRDGDPGSQQMSRSEHLGPAGG